MKYKTTDFKRLIDAICSQLNTQATRQGFMKIEEYCIEHAEKLGLGVRHEYIYDRYRSKSDAQSARPDHLNALARILGFNTYEDFVAGKHPSTTKQATPFEIIGGKWTSIVRCNSGKEQLIISPVEFKMEKTKLVMSLQGGENAFTGEVFLKGYCLEVTLKSGGVKNIHLIFKLGNLKSIEVLQGVYSGISSGNAPICGVELLVRLPKNETAQTTHQRIDFDEYSNRGHNETLVVNYFKNKAPYKIDKVSSFGWDDLNP